MAKKNTIHVNREKVRYHIGIDCGTRTGIAVWDSDEQRFVRITTCTITEAMAMVLVYPDPQLYIENPNLRTWFGHSGRQKLQGAGSVKRDYAIWVEFAKMYSLAFLQIHPKNVKDLSGEDGRRFFAQLTGWDKKTSVHAREAAYMVFNR